MATPTEATENVAHAAVARGLLDRVLDLAFPDNDEPGLLGDFIAPGQ